MPPEVGGPGTGLQSRFVREDRRHAITHIFACPFAPAPERLGGVLDNARFLILPWVQVTNRASKVLAMAAALAALDLDETVTVTEADAAPFVAQLQALAVEEFA
ncbi:MAG: hypothetical protein KFB96_15310 [Thiocapsa sp.]|uniref:hypothetical protein n=1 Tax=Thiocapsa sp. TaxID=2024551 RepID=UPI001BF037F4|nr:hypothetical protein [Thiocapsa sp.]QVL51556.1 MAG: hypothetical protein KFB96_15310 [Thiocapsa sp.]